jgi:hypothetical protein
MPCWRFRSLLPVLLLPLCGAATAGLQDDSGGVPFAGLADPLGEVVAPASLARGFDTLADDRATTLLQIPFATLEADGTGLQAGPLLRYRDALGASHPVLAATPALDDRLEQGGFVAWRSGAWHLQGSTVGGNPLAGDTGLLGLSGTYMLQGSERLTLLFTGSATYASDVYLNGRGLERTDGLRDGRSDLGLSVNASYRLGADWSLVGMFGVHHTLDDGGVADLPGTNTRFSAGAAFRLDF